MTGAKGCVDSSRTAHTRSRRRRKPFANTRGQPFVSLLARRMHCPLAAYTAPSQEGRWMTTAETARRLLLDASGEALCDACLAFACSVSLAEMHQLTEELLTRASFQRRDRCISCRRTVPAIAYAARKCTHCSHPVLPGDNAIGADGDVL